MNSRRELRVSAGFLQKCPKRDEFFKTQLFSLIIITLPPPPHRVRKLFFLSQNAIKKVKITKGPNLFPAANFSAGLAGKFCQELAKLAASLASSNKPGILQNWIEFVSRLVLTNHKDNTEEDHTFLLSF